MNNNDVDYHRFQRSRYETNIMDWMKEDKLWRDIFRCIFDTLYTLFDNENKEDEIYKNYGKEINCKNGFYIVHSHPEYIVLLQSNLDKIDPFLTITIESDRIENETISYYRIYIK